MNTKKIILSIITIAVICMALFLCGCTKKDGDVGDNPNHTTSSPSTTAPISTMTANPTADATQSPLESMIPKIMD